MYQIIFILIVFVALIACFISMWTSMWARKCKNEINHIDKWLSNYAMSICFKSANFGPSTKTILYINGTLSKIDINKCNGISFRKMYKTLMKIRKGNIADPEFDQTDNLMSLVYLSQSKDEDKTVWED